MITPEMLAKSGTEHGEQCAVFCWAQQNLTRYPMLEWMHAIPNGGLRDKVAAAKLKAEGVKRGVADIFLPYPRTKHIQLLNAQGGPCGTPFFESYHGLYVEMKRAKGVMSDFTVEQIEFQGYCEQNNYAWIGAFGWRSAVTGIENYLGNGIIRRYDDESRR